MLFWPELSLVPSSVFLNWNLLLNLQQPHILFTILSGTLSGFILYGIAYSLSCLSYLTPQYNAIRHESLFFGLTLVGAVLGWQANLAIFALFALGWFTLLLTTNRNRFVVLAPFVFLCATLIHHIFWRFLSTYYLGLTT
jgi:hypothetical protein